MKVRCVLLGVQVVAVITFLYFGSMHIWHCQPYGIHVHIATIHARTQYYNIIHPAVCSKYYVHDYSKKLYI